MNAFWDGLWEKFHKTQHDSVLNDSLHKLFYSDEVIDKPVKF